MLRTPTVQDVARRAGVSRQTVSNVLNNPSVVRASTRERVEEAIAALGYRPHTAARQLRTRRTATIGVRLDPYHGGISGVVLDRFVHALTERATAEGMRVLIYTAKSAEDEIARVNELLDGGEIDSVVITGTFRSDPRADRLQQRKVPLVCFGRPWWSEQSSARPHRWVDVDSAAGTRAATEHALSLGAGEVSFLGWPEGSGTGDERARGWREAAAGAGALGVRLEVEEEVAAARAAASQLLRGAGTQALVCASDALAVGAHLAAIDAGRPELPIYGFDNTPTVHALGISSVEQLPEEVAAGTLDLLRVSPQDEDQPPHVLITPRLVVR